MWQDMANTNLIAIKPAGHHYWPTYVQVSRQLDHDVASVWPDGLWLRDKNSSKRNNVWQMVRCQQ